MFAWALSSVGRATDLHSVGREFESPRVHKNKEHSDYVFVGCRNALAFWRQKYKMNEIDRSSILL